MKNDKKMKSLRDMIMFSRVKQEKTEKTKKNASPRYLSQKNILPLKEQLEISSLNLDSNEGYQIIENLSESKVLGSLLLK